MIDFFTKICGLDYREDEILRILGIIRTNALNIQDPNMKISGVSGRIVYPTLSYLSHSCICNAKYKYEQTALETEYQKFKLTQKLANG